MGIALSVITFDIDCCKDNSTMLLVIFLSISFKLCLGQYAVSPELYHGYNQAGAIHISGHMGPLRIIPGAASSYQSHIPYHVVNHAPIYHVEPAPVAVHPVPVAHYPVDTPAVIPVHEEPVSHYAGTTIHPDHVEDHVEVVETKSTDREHRNIAINVDFVPYEVSLPVLSVEKRKPIVTKRKKFQNRYSRNWNFDLDIDNLDIDATTNFHSNVSVNKDLGHLEEIESYEK